MRLFKCLVPVLVLLFVEGSSACLLQHLAHGDRRVPGGFGHQHVHGKGKLFHPHATNAFQGSVISSSRSFVYNSGDGSENTVSQASSRSISTAGEASAFSSSSADASMKNMPIFDN